MAAIAHFSLLKPFSGVRMVLIYEYDPFNHTGQNKNNECYSVNRIPDAEQLCTFQDGHQCTPRGHLKAPSERNIAIYNGSSFLEYYIESWTYGLLRMVKLTLICIWLFNRSSGSYYCQNGSPGGYLKTPSERNIAMYIDPNYTLILH